MHKYIRCLPWWIDFDIDIKGCLRISVHKLVRLCELTLSFITALALIDLLGYFKSGFEL